MADRAKGEVASDDPRNALYRKIEFFPTPPWAARAGGELIRALDPGNWTCWEPAAGQGHMAWGLADYFGAVKQSDIHAHGAFLDHPLDFMSDDAAQFGAGVDWIVTNPPFATAAEFVRLGLQRARRGVAILARLSFLESAGRHPLFFPDDPAAPRLTIFAPFFERVPMVLGRWDPKASTATAYAWFIWMTPEAVALQNVGLTATIGIPPGTRERLTLADDVRLFAAPGAAPLFDNQGGDGE